MMKEFMSEVQAHYEDLLADCYSWMSGGLNQKIAQSRDFFQQAGIGPRLSGSALDLGCGSGFQTIALADLGFQVTAVDTSEKLLTELAAHAIGRSIFITNADMRDSQIYLDRAPFEIVVCMGDSIVHLNSLAEVEQSMRSIAKSLEPDGHLIITFRDLTTERFGADRAIPVRLDDNRLMATFLEYQPEHVVVNDMVFDRREGHWVMNKSSYRKLRLAPWRFAELLNQIGFRDVRQTIESGLVTTIARGKLDSV